MPPKNLNNTYHAPPNRTPYLICLAIMVLSAAPTPSWLLPNTSTPPPGLSSPLPANLATGLRWFKNFNFYFLYGAHGIETLVFMKKLKEHGVGFMSGAWCKWVATCFVGGQFCYKWFDEVVGKTK